MIASLRYTYDFVRGALPPDAHRVLEVGCGDGALSEHLASDGLDLVAIDADAECVAAAKSRGIDARLGAWPIEIDGSFDAVLFTRSLHHIHDLGGAVAAARSVLAETGRVIVEDFRAEGGTARSADWYRTMVKELAEGGALAEGASVEALVEELPGPTHDGHELHSSHAIEDALRRKFAVVAADAAYYFRYLEPQLRDDDAPQWLLNVELELIGAGEIDALGKRFVAAVG